MLSFQISSLDEQPVSDAGLEGIWLRPFDGRVHPGNRRTVCKIFDCNGVGLRNQMPKGQRVFVGLQRINRHNFNHGQFEFSVKAENDGVGVGVIAFALPDKGAPGAGSMVNVNTFRSEPVSIQVERDATERYHQANQHPLFFGHTRNVLTR